MPILPITINPADPDPAPFAEFKIIENNRGKVKLFIKSTKLAYVYCVVGYIYMPEPTYKETKGRNLTDNIYNYSMPLYYEGYLDTAAFEGTIILDGLSPSTEYTVYCYTMNLNRVPSTTFNKINFKNTSKLWPNHRSLENRYFHYENKSGYCGSGTER